MTARVTAAGTVVNTATRQSSTPVDPNPANDTGTATLTSSVVADLSVTKTPSVPAAAAGTSVHVDRRRRQQWPQHCAGSVGRRLVPGAVHRRDVDVHCQQRIELHAATGTGPIATTVDLLAGGSATFVATGLSAPAGSDPFINSPLVNVATVAVAAGTTDPDLSNNTDSSAVGLASLADVQVTLTGPSTLAPGTSGDYLITVANVGPSQGSSATLMLPTPAGFLPVTVRGACSSLPCALGPLAPGEQRQVIATLSPPADYAAAPAVTVRAMAVSDPFDPRPENNAASVVTTITEAAGLSITGLVTDGDGGPLSGDRGPARRAPSLLETTTAADGTYAFPGLPPGHDYTVTPVRVRVRLHAAAREPSRR